MTNNSSQNPSISSLYLLSIQQRRRFHLYLETLDSREKRMCIKASEWNLYSLPCYPICPNRPKRSKIKVHRLTRRRRKLEEEVVGEMRTDLELKNLKLYLENRCIIEENEKLKKKALLLHQENQALMNELHKKFSHLEECSTLGFDRD